MAFRFLILPEIAPRTTGANRVPSNIACMQLMQTHQSPSACQSLLAGSLRSPPSPAPRLSTQRLYGARRRAGSQPAGYVTSTRYTTQPLSATTTVCGLDATLPPPPPSHAHRCRCPKSVRHTRAPAVRTYLAHLPAASCPCPRPHEHADVSTECHSTPSIPHASPPHSHSPLTSAPSRRALADPPCSLRLRGVRTRRPACPPP